METNKNLLLWKRSVQLLDLYTFNEAQSVCPKGYRLPSEEEQEWLIKNSDYHFDREKKEGVFLLSDGFELRLPAAGYRDGNGDSNNQGTYGYYWSSSPSGTDATYVRFNGGPAHVYTNGRVNAFSVRCVPIKVEEYKRLTKCNIMETDSIQTQGIKGMTREELIELVGTLSKELEKSKSDVTLYRDWSKRDEEARILAEKKILAAKAFFEVI